jgi:hypothetical protein
MLPTPFPPITGSQILSAHDDGACLLCLIGLACLAHASHPRRVLPLALLHSGAPLLQGLRVAFGRLVAAAVAKAALWRLAIYGTSGLGCGNYARLSAC